MGVFPARMFVHCIVKYQQKPERAVDTQVFESQMVVSAYVIDRDPSQLLCKGSKCS